MIENVAVVVAAVMIAGDSLYIRYLREQLDEARRKDAEP
jgi:hypothetical protein